AGGAAAAARPGGPERGADLHDRPRLLRDHHPGGDPPPHPGQHRLDHVPRRTILKTPGWYTACAPYQPEISQGRLEALLNFQTMVEDLTGLAVAGASLLDEATAAAEAMPLARRAARTGSVFLADSRCLPQTLAVLATRAAPLGIGLVVAEVTEQEVAAQ